MQISQKKKTHLLGSLFNKIAGLFLKNTFCSYFCRALIETMIFYFLYFATVGSKELACMIFLFWENTREISWIITKCLFLLILFSICFCKFQLFDDTSKSSYGQILPGNGEGNQAWEVYHEDWKYSCDLGATTINVSMDNFHT